MRDELRAIVLGEAARKRDLSDRERHELLAGVKLAIEAFRHDLTDPEPEELGRRERVIDGLEQAIAAAVMCSPDPPFPSETLALAELREDGLLLGDPAFRREPTATMLGLWRAALDNYVEVERFFEKGRRGSYRPLRGCRMPRELQVLILGLCGPWAANVDSALGLPASGMNPLIRFLDAALDEACGTARPPISTIHDFVKKRARQEIGCDPTEDEGVDFSIVQTVLKSPYSID